MSDPITKKGEFYLGRIFDSQQGRLTEKPLIYEADDLTTHAVVVGMTGSGKTGLCVGMLEEALAFQEAEKWQKGLADWGIPAERLDALARSVQFAVFTPGSTSGLPVSILASLKAPSIPWEENREILREKISGTATALLGLVGLREIDPVRSREHILLSNLFERAWSAGQDLDLGELILQVQNPPFKKLGVFDINAFYPQKDRFDLAMQLNNILAFSILPI
jgi:hypothetical protein